MKLATDCVSCPVCSNSFDSDARAPLISLRCGHTFCRSCVTQIQKTPHIHYWNCPSCKTRYHKELEFNLIAFFPVNRILLTFLRKGKHRWIGCRHKPATHLCTGEFCPDPKMKSGCLRCLRRTHVMCEEADFKSQVHFSEIKLRAPELHEQAHMPTCLAHLKYQIFLLCTPIFQYWEHIFKVFWNDIVRRATPFSKVLKRILNDRRASMPPSALQPLLSFRIFKSKTGMLEILAKGIEEGLEEAASDVMSLLRFYSLRESIKLGMTPPGNEPNGLLKPRTFKDFQLANLLALIEIDPSLGEAIRPADGFRILPTFLSWDLLPDNLDSVETFVNQFAHPDLFVPHPPPIGFEQAPEIASPDRPGSCRHRNPDLLCLDPNCPYNPETCHICVVEVHSACDSNLILFEKHYLFFEKGREFIVIAQPQFPPVDALLKEFLQAVAASLESWLRPTEALQSTSFSTPVASGTKNPEGKPENQMADPINLSVPDPWGIPSGLSEEKTKRILVQRLKYLSEGEGFWDIRTVLNARMLSALATLENLPEAFKHKTSSFMVQFNLPSVLRKILAAHRSYQIQRVIFNELTSKW